MLPIVVDLDGTLIRNDLLVECAKQFLRARPWSAPLLVAWLWQGRPVLKRKLAEQSSIDYRSLSFNDELVAWLRERKTEGRRIVLATASHSLLAADAVAHLGVFDEVLATEGNVNLKAAAKRDALVQRFGTGGFEYVGNEDADFAVWQSAAAAHVVTASARLKRRVQALGKPGRVFAPGR